MDSMVAKIAWVFENVKHPLDWGSYKSLRRSQQICAKSLLLMQAWIIGLGELDTKLRFRFTMLGTCIVKALKITRYQIPAEKLQGLTVKGYARGLATQLTVALAHSRTLILGAGRLNTVSQQLAGAERTRFLAFSEGIAKALGRKPPRVPKRRGSDASEKTGSADEQVEEEADLEAEAAEVATKADLREEGGAEGS